MIKIGGGKFKGRSIKVPKTTLTRPSTSFSRKVIFDTLSPYISEAVVLDLFAGSGALGIEAISRGAKFAYFVDNGSKSIATIKENTSHLDIKEDSLILKNDCLMCLQAWNNEKLDIIFLDPPYSLLMSELSSILSYINERDILQTSGIICLEIPSKKGIEMIKLIPDSFSIFKEKKKGDTLLLFIKN